jgi:hypothetical protein
MSEPPVLNNAPAAAPSSPLPPPRYTDDERSMLDHLGLPFFYRHTPAPAMRKGLFWMTFASIGLVLFTNFLFMPHAEGSVSRTIRESVFGYGQGYRDVVQGCKAIFHQLFVAALIVSGIIAPGFATFSLSTERVTGTMESLRLSPMSNTAIILGKIFASAYWMHMVSALMIGLGICFGIVGDLGIANIAFAVLGIVMGCLTLHAVGAYFAVFTVSARGFGAVVGLLAVGFVMSMLPMAGMSEQGMEFFTYLSPWGCMDGLFWHEMHGRYRYSNAAQFYGMPGAVKFFVFAFHATAFSLLIYAASRKLESPEQSALPRFGWCLVWLFVLLTAFGISGNTFRNQSIVGFNINWMFAGAVSIFGFLGTCVLALLDHSFDRDIVLAEECERVAGRENKKPPFRLGHAVFTASLTALSAAVILFFFYMGGTMTGQAVPVSLGVCTAAVTLAFLIAVALETSSIGYMSTWSRTATAFIAVGILFAILFAPLIHLSVANRRWHQAMWLANSQFPNPDLPPAAKQNQMNNYWNNSWARQPHILFYIKDIKSWDDLVAHRAMYENAPIRIFMAFHPTATAMYPAMFFGVVGLLFWWRKRKYAALAREAEASIAHADSIAPVVEKPVLVDAVAGS